MIHQTYRIALTWHFFCGIHAKYAMWIFIVDVVHDFESSLQPDVGRGFLHVSNVFLFLSAVTCTSCCICFISGASSFCVIHIFMNIYCSPGPSSLLNLLHAKFFRGTQNIYSGKARNVSLKLQNLVHFLTTFFTMFILPLMTGHLF